jgi:hypothetical protein
MAPKPEDRQLAIDVVAETMVENGMDDERAEDFATHVIDEAIKRAGS